MPSSRTQPAAASDSAPQLVRGLGLGSATALNMIDMIGVGPFITLPLIVSAMGGPQAMLGWILGALFALCDGMVWAELGAAMPGSGGSYRYLSEIYGRHSLGRLVSFLFVWQLSFSAPLSIASGCIGFSQYAAYLWPALERVWHSRDLVLDVPGLGPLEAHVEIGPGTLVAIGVCLTAIVLLYRRITNVARLSVWLWTGVTVTMAWIIVAGLTHFHAALAFSFPTNAFAPTRHFFTGLGSAMLVATYDYWGYYNVCFLGGEVKDPGRNIPRALLLSVVLVAGLYLAMNISILGVVPWQELDRAARLNLHLHIASLFMQRIYGSWAGYAITLLVMWAAFGSVFSLLLGYSRVLYAGALDGNYFRILGRVHPRHLFPYASLLALGVTAAVFCLFRLADVIAALVVIRILIQFLLQAAGVMVLRLRRPGMPRPFRMWLYPVPALLACGGFTFILFARRNFMREIRYATAILAIGIAVYILRAWRRSEWPFGEIDEAGPQDNLS